MGTATPWRVSARTIAIAAAWRTTIPWVPTGYGCKYDTNRFFLQHGHTSPHGLGAAYKPKSTPCFQCFGNRVPRGIGKIALGRMKRVQVRPFFKVHGLEEARRFSPTPLQSSVARELRRRRMLRRQNSAESKPKRLMRLSPLNNVAIDPESRMRPSPQSNVALEPRKGRTNYHRNSGGQEPRKPPRRPEIGIRTCTKTSVK